MLLVRGCGFEGVLVTKMAAGERGSENESGATGREGDCSTVHR